MHWLRRRRAQPHHVWPVLSNVLLAVALVQVTAYTDKGLPRAAYHTIPTDAREPRGRRLEIKEAKVMPVGRRCTVGGRIAQAHLVARILVAGSGAAVPRRFNREALGADLVAGCPVQQCLGDDWNRAVPYAEAAGQRRPEGDLVTPILRNADASALWKFILPAGANCAVSVEVAVAVSAAVALARTAGHFVTLAVRKVAEVDATDGPIVVQLRLLVSCCPRRAARH
eukprot:scaffold67720_cov63-Phaeocystis_antarctica.AAC.6